MDGTNRPKIGETGYFCRNTTTMTSLEKKQQLIEKVQAIPDRYYDDVSGLLDTILATEHQRDERFRKLLAETSAKYKAVWEALA